MTSHHDAVPALDGEIDHSARRCGVSLCAKLLLKTIVSQGHGNNNLHDDNLTLPTGAQPHQKLIDVKHVSAVTQTLVYTC